MLCVLKTEVTHTHTQIQMEALIPAPADCEVRSVIKVFENTATGHSEKEEWDAIYIAYV